MGLPAADRVRQLEDARAARGRLALAGALAEQPGRRTGDARASSRRSRCSARSRPSWRAPASSLAARIAMTSPRVPSPAPSRADAARTAGPRRSSSAIPSVGTAWGRPTPWSRPRPPPAWRRACSWCCASARPRPSVRPGETRGRARPPAGRQLARGVAADRLVVAYEPVWAIGTGKTATLADIAESHAAIGRRLAALAPERARDRHPLRRLGQGRQCARDHGRPRRGRRAGRRRLLGCRPASGPSIRAAGALDSGLAAVASVAFSRCGVSH